MISNSLKTYSSMEIRWNPEVGFKSTVRRDDYNLSESEWKNVKQRAIPAGSYWDKYLGYRTIRIFPLEGIKDLVVLSVSRVVTVYENENLPETNIFLLDRKSVDHLKEMGAKWLIHEIEEKTDEYMVSLDDIQASNQFNHDQFYTFGGYRGQALRFWPYLEYFFINSFFECWPKQKLAISTLCTPQDQLKYFDKICIIDQYISDFKKLNVIKSYSIIVLKSESILDIEAVSSISYSIERFSDWFKAKINISRFVLVIIVCFSFAIGLFSSRYLLKTPDLNLPSSEDSLLNTSSSSLQSSAGVSLGVPDGFVKP